MPKRRASADTDDESVEVSVAKRARTQSEEPEEDLEIIRPFSGSAPRKRKSNAGGGGGGDDDDGDDPDENDEKFEEEHGDQIRESIKLKGKTQGGVAEHGIIESVEMHNFMCHKFLTFTFGPQINFIIGHNGSGKSAVLSAITVVLGGKSNSTGRGSGLKSFIKEGTSVAEVSISIKNGGEEAFKPREYGKSIVITRRFTKEGNSTWKIRGATGATVSTKREELAAICDHMNIQVDNPMNVLTQDAARQFLSASAPSDKYKLFLRGTQLSQLSEEYEACFDNINQTAKILAQKKLLLPELREKFHEVQVRFNEAKKAREQKRRVEDLRKEMAWAHVAAKEKELTEKLNDVAHKSRRIPRIEESIAKEQASLTEANQLVQQYEAEVDALGNMDDLEEKKQQLGDQLRANKDIINNFRKCERDMNTTLSGIKSAIEKTITRIAEENKRLESHSVAKRQEEQRKLEEAKQHHIEADAKFRDFAAQKLAKIEESKRLQADETRIQQEFATAKRHVDEAHGLINQYHQQQADNLAPFGRNLREVIAKANSMNWHGDKPLGPLGMYVKLREPKWASLMRSQLHHAMTSWAISDARDRDQLKRLLDSSGNKASIIIYERDLFDFRSGEPPLHCKTALRVLDISDEYVKRILINSLKIERILVGDRRRDVEDQLRSIGGGAGWSLDNFRVNVFGEGGGSSTGLGKPPGNANMMFQGSDAAGRLHEFQNQLAAAEQEYHRCGQEMERLRQQHSQFRRAIDEASNKESLARKEASMAKSRKDHLQALANNDLPASISGLEASKQEAERERDSILVQFEDTKRQHAELDVKQRELVAELDTLKASIGDFTARKEAAMEKVSHAARARMTAQSNKEHFESKLDAERGILAEAEEVVNVVQTEFSDWTENANKFCKGVRFENPRPVDTVKRELDSTTKALQDREKKQGATVEEMTVELNKRKSELEAVDKDLKSMSKLNKALKESLLVRIDRWHKFRRHIALRCKIIFQYNLSHRGYDGKVLFDHDKQILSLKVQTEDLAGTQGGRDKDPRSLSGGEKSFSTICLLLSLWESIGCPLRCLDEFDVFMDAVNRRISMRMMIDTANASDKKQYILITPQDMNNITIGPTVRVHRMTDPERGQGVLGFAN